MFRRLVTTLTLVSAVLVPTVPASADPPQPDTKVRTDAGYVRGYATEDHLVFKGVPYAAPPTGDRRFRAPQPVQPWSAVRDATEPASKCAQTTRWEGSVGSEDCLYLNIHVPTKNRRPLPVVVYWHGGGFGGGDSALYDPRPYSGGGNVIVVTANYRLGALGFLGHREMSDPWAGNFGIADQVAALRWVRRNIAAFGGDPDNVTTAGESAGAFSVCAQVAAPAARGLFDRAISESGPCGTDLLSRAEAGRRADSAATELDCADTDDVMDCLRALPAEDLSRLRWKQVTLTENLTNLPFMPVAGTPALPAQPQTAVETGIGSRVPMLLGTNRDEMRTVILDRLRSGQGHVTAEEYEQFIRARYGGHADRVLAAYPLADYASPDLALATLMTDDGRGVGPCPNLDFAEVASRYSPVFVYEFSEPTGAVFQGFPEGAAHGAHTTYFFNSYHPSQEPSPTTELGDTLISQWSHFARVGHPGAGWAPYRSDGVAREFTASDVRPVDVASRHRCDLWADVLQNAK
ncbi:carboxylesterase [Actinobacteria bacterium YIM 96077]|uniref:Carboxylesterase n=2 Tax=Phytoactinopolyspora halophila TaxID=1981511 RepID=A0A329QL67_9ACTN|nr:carboxylesterase [Actinobacteria bacterium YIM 96077]RAW13135.1 carboxylesterase [Phytoactinopolyspora halophila]